MDPRLQIVTAPRGVAAGTAAIATIGRKTMRNARIAIVGMGPRGLTVLKRLVANERAQKSAAKRDC